jgi:carbonic anhydrase
MKMKQCLTLFLLTITLSALLAQHVNYEDQSHWGELCEQGTEQSPIDFSDDLKLRNANGKIKVNSYDWNIIKNVKLEFIHHYKLGLTLDPKLAGSISVTIENVLLKYNLKDIHFHLPSEHTIKGKGYDMEMHMVHQMDQDVYNANKNTNPNFNAKRHTYLVIGVFFDSTTNAENAELKNLNADTLSDITNFNINNLVTQKQNFYYYRGGLTTPPCSELVYFMIFKNPQTFSKTQMESFKKHYEHHHYKHGDARKVQPVKKRKVYFLGENNRRLRKIK